MPSITRIPGFDPVKKEYLPLDKDAWLKAHEIERKGRQQGNINRPTTESIELDSTESDIVAWIGERARTCREDVTNCLLDLKRSLTETEDEHDLQALEQRVEETKREAESRLTQEIERRRNAMSLREASVKDERIALDEFKSAANLRRPADYSHRKTAWIWLVSFAALEIILNATLLMDVNAFGLLGLDFANGLHQWPQCRRLRPACWRPHTLEEPCVSVRQGHELVRRGRVNPIRAGVQPSGGAFS